MAGYFSLLQGILQLGADLRIAPDKQTKGMRDPSVLGDVKRNGGFLTFQGTRPFWFLQVF
ncbi:hypothetical protein [Paenibacillus sp. URB8-2]|uniref:hypothetical protein n=1 Tax=Paenibacillus sp. URB8-2 TaxID=2741301 RepID=UPI0015BDAF47|nr:hypothetical protein [Paenibacillus sp. URB8-2]BCG58620.1 hypothetical protein PUR_20450 [Paenibacillus sp. URB8-2]